MSIYIKTWENWTVKGIIVYSHIKYRSLNSLSFFFINQVTKIDLSVTVQKDVVSDFSTDTLNSIYKCNFLIQNIHYETFKLRVSFCC